MTETMQELELEVSRTIAAPLDKVFEAWLSPRTLSRFMKPPLANAADAKVQNDPVKGGRFSIVMVSEDKEIPHAGTYLEIVPHSRLAFTWESPYSLDDSVVTIDFAEAGPGKTAINLRQVKFRSEEAREGHRAGWSEIFGVLEDILASDASTTAAGA